MGRVAVFPRGNVPLGSPARGAIIGGEAVPRFETFQMSGGSVCTEEAGVSSRDEERRNYTLNTARCLP